MNLKRIAVAGILLLAVQAGADEVKAPQTQKEKLGYTIGADTGRVLRQQEFDVDVDLLIKGLKDGLSGEKTLMTDQEMQATRSAIQSEMLRKQAALKEKQAQARKKQAEDNKKAGDAFLAENGKKEGVVTLPSGLQYRIIKAGEGNKPTDNNTVEVHYRGTHIDGKVFDSSYDRGQPADFKVTGGVIQGFSEALKLMPVGSKWQVFIPPALGYGDRGAGRDIGPGETLVFEIELLGIK